VEAVKAQQTQIKTLESKVTELVLKQEMQRQSAHSHKRQAPQQGDASTSTSASNSGQPEEITAGTQPGWAAKLQAQVEAQQSVIADQQKAIETLLLMAMTETDKAV
jgi:hypothetical protein